jgi:predicted peptidase
MLYTVLKIQKRKTFIIFLHGSGEKGTDIEKVKVHGPFKYLKIMIWTLMFWLLNVQKTNIGIEVLYQLILKSKRECH